MPFILQEEQEDVEDVQLIIHDLYGSTDRRAHIDIIQHELPLQTIPSLSAGLANGEQMSARD